MSIVRHPNPCDNMNHRRHDAPVGHCPKCGGIVNARLAVEPCTESKHAVSRRQQSIFCVDCGEQLVMGR